MTEPEANREQPERPDLTGPADPADLASELAHAAAAGSADGPAAADWQPVIDRLLALPLEAAPGAGVRDAVWSAVQAAMQADASARRTHAERIAAELGEPSVADDIERWLATSPMRPAPDAWREPTWQGVEQAIAARVERSRSLAAELVHEPATKGDADDEPSRHAPAAELANQQEWAGLIDRVTAAPAFVEPPVSLREQTWAKLQAEFESSTSTPSTVPAGRVRWLRPVRAAAAVLVVALGAAIIWFATQPATPPGPESYGVSAILGPTPIERPVHAGETIAPTDDLAVVQSGPAEYVVDTGTPVTFESRDRVSVGAGQLAVIAHREVRIFTRHDPPVELVVLPDGDTAAMAWIRVNERMESVRRHDGRVQVDCRMIPLAKTLVLIESATGTTMRLDDESGRIGSELISLTVDSAADELPAVFAAVIESRFPVRLHEVADGFELRLINATGTRGESPDWVTVEARHGRVRVLAREREAVADSDHHVRVRGADFFASVGEASRLSRWPASAANRVLPYLPRLEDSGRFADTIDSLVAVWADTRPGFTPHVVEIGGTALDGLSLRFQADATGNPGALFQVDGGVKLLREGDNLHGWTVDSIERRGMHLVSSDGQQRTFLAFN